jgi:O-antigen/teichoic acid export membrane protein
MMLAAVPVFFGRELWGRFLFSGMRFTSLVLLAYGIAMGTILCKLALGYVLSREQALKYGWLNLSRVLIYALLGCSAVMLLSRKVQGILWASFIAQGAIGVWSFSWLLRETGIKVVWAKILRALRYGLPLVPSGLALWVVALSDRYFLSRYNGLDAVGVYSLGYQLGTAPMFVFSAFQLAWPQFAFRIAEDPHAGSTYARLTRYAALGGGMAFLILSLFAREWVGLLAGGAFREAYRVIPLVALAHLFNIAYFLFATGITIKEKTGWLPLITGISGVANLAANFLLIPRFGPIGAALATLAGYLILAGLTYVFSNHFLPVPYEFGRIGGIMGVLLLVWLVSILVNSWPPYLLSLGGRMVLCLAFPLLVILFGGVSKDEVKKFGSLSFLR